MTGQRGCHPVGNCEWTRTPANGLFEASFASVWGFAFSFSFERSREGQNGTGIGVGCLLTNCRRRCQCLSARSRLTVCVTAYDTCLHRHWRSDRTRCSAVGPHYAPCSRRLARRACRSLSGPRCLPLSSLTSEAATPHERPQAEASAGRVALAAVRAKAAYRERHPGAVPGAALLWSV